MMLTTTDKLGLWRRLWHAASSAVGPSDGEKAPAEQRRPAAPDRPNAGGPPRRPATSKATPNYPLRTQTEARPGALRLALELFDAVATHEPVLEIGCGRGDLCIDLVRSGYFRVTGIDRSPATIRRARRFASGLEVRPLPDFIAADTTNLPFAAGGFSVVVMQQLLSTRAGEGDRARLLGEARRVLRYGGRLYLTAFARTPEEGLSADALRAARGAAGASFVWRYTEQELTAVLTEAGFGISQLWHEDPITRTGCNQHCMVAVATRMR